jgi:glycosyltransferase involved in cell wall biosynthesis
MHILFCNYEYPPLGGGGGVINADLAEELAKKHDVSVLTSRAMDLEKRDVVNGVEVIRVPVLGRNQAAAASMMSMFSYLPSGAWNARSMVKSGRFDIVNTHFVVPTGPLGAYLASVAGIPNVLTVHGGDLYDPSKASSPHRHPLLRAAIRRLLRRADAVVGQSRNTIENVHNFYLPDFPCGLIPLGIKRPPSAVGGRAGWNLAEEDRVMITVGRLVARKAVTRLIETVANLEDPAAKLIVVGDGPLLPDLKAQAQELGVESQVLFAGFVTAQDKIDLLNLSDVYVSTSQHEGFGLVFLEAMAAGLPVICYDFGGQSDFLEDGVTGSLVPLNDLATFKDKCKTYLSSLEKRKAAGAENLRRVESFFIDTCAKEYEELFEQLVSR